MGRGDLVEVHPPDHPPELRPLVDAEDEAQRVDVLLAGPGAAIGRERLSVEHRAAVVP